MLTLDEALALLAAARKAAAVPMAFAVVDPAGHLLALSRMEGAPFVTSTVCQGKAWTAAAYGTPSDAQREKMLPMPNFATALSSMFPGLYTPQTGGLPVYRAGTLAGAIGGSGGTGQQDEDACRAAVQELGLTVTSGS